MKTEKLYEFLVLSQTLNYSRAAEALYISQSVLSKHIMEMEQELNTRLFFRSTHDVRLTEAGLLLAQKAGALIDKCNTAARLAKMDSLPTKGTINIACAPEIACSSRLQTFIAHFMERYPAIDVRFTVKTDGTPEHMMHDSLFDFIFTPCEYAMLPPRIRQLLLWSHDTYAAFSAGHRLLSRPQIYLRELSGETILVPFAHELFGPYAKNWLLIQKYTHGRVSSVPVSNLATALFLASIGKGIVIIPHHAQSLAPGNIYLSRIANEICCFNEYVYYKEKEEGAAKLFFEELQIAFRPQKDRLSSN